jgi:hypothetical protein
MRIVRAAYQKKGICRLFVQAFFCLSDWQIQSRRLINAATTRFVAGFAGYPSQFQDAVPAIG